MLITIRQQHRECTHSSAELFQDITEFLHYPIPNYNMPILIVLNFCCVIAPTPLIPITKAEWYLQDQFLVIETVRTAQYNGEKERFRVAASFNKSRLSPNILFATNLKTP
jgi:hypothetical protein